MNILELGGKILTGIRNLRSKKVVLHQLNTSKSQVLKHQVWHQLLQKNVQADGQVNYKGFQKERTALQTYLEELSNNPPAATFSRADQLAYWINAYNAFTVELILQHYPLKSIKDIEVTIPFIDSPWRLKFFKIGGIAFDLDTIEHEIIRKEFDEPRIHFCVNCASVSCPRLRNEAYTADQLEAQLQDQAVYFLHNSIKNKLSADQLQLSRIFKWYESDFTKKTTLIEYIQNFTSVQLSAHTPIQFMEYDWNLNE